MCYYAPRPYTHAFNSARHIRIDSCAILPSASPEVQHEAGTVVSSRDQLSLRERSALEQQVIGGMDQWVSG